MKSREDVAVGFCIEEGTPLSPSQKVRLSVESLSRDGYLFAIDREQYAHGTFGDPVLIFLTKKVSGCQSVKSWATTKARYPHCLRRCGSCF
jgi:hypothetical protein